MHPPPRDRLGAPQQTREERIKNALEVARRALKRGDGWECDQSHLDRLIADCAKLGVYGEPQITIRLRKSFDEITVQDLRERADTSYAGLEQDQTLFEAAWDSEVSELRMYVKFCLLPDGRIEICTFHESEE